MKTKTVGKVRTLKIAAAVIAIFMLLSLMLIIGTDTSWGRVRVTRMTLDSADGDRVSAMLYKPNSATEQTPAPCVMIIHGGNDMLEQAGTYALELARRGYVAVTFDYTACHNSDIATGPSETAPDEKSGLATMGAETAWNTIRTYRFVDQSKLVTMGHSMGGTYSMAFAIRHQQEVFLQLNLGMNNYGAAANHDHNFNFVNILGDADESALSRSNNNVANVFKAEQLRRVFAGDYTSAADKLPEIELDKVYTATGTDGKTYTRTAYMPQSCHAYYLVTDDAIQTVLYAITSQVGLGLDSGVASYADHAKISMAWKVKDLGFFMMFACAVASMFVAAAALLDSRAFASLKLERTASTALPRRSAPWYAAVVILALLPVALYRVGILSSAKFLGIDISKIWLLAGTNNCYISWQWTVALAMLAFFLVFHFAYGKKHGGSLANYGFSTSSDGRWDFGYIGRALLFGLAVVGSGYLVFLLMSAYTQQGIHITTFMLTPIQTNRTLCVVMYFLFQIPYFLASSLAVRSIGLNDTEDTPRQNAKSILLGTLVSVGGLFVLWLVFVLILNLGNTLTSLNYFMKDRMYVYSIAILPLVIGMAVANALNIYVCKKTNRIWAGLFTALLWGAWIVVCSGGIAKYLY